MPKGELGPSASGRDFFGGVAKVLARRRPFDPRKVVLFESKFIKDISMFMSASDRRE